MILKCFNQIDGTSCLDPNYDYSKDLDQFFEHSSVEMDGLKNFGLEASLSFILSGDGDADYRLSSAHVAQINLLSLVPGSVTTWKALNELMMVVLKAPELFNEIALGIFVAWLIMGNKVAKAYDFEPETKSKPENMDDPSLDWTWWYDWAWALWARIKVCFSPTL